MEKKEKRVVEKMISKIFRKIFPKKPDLRRVPCSCESDLDANIIIADTKSSFDIVKNIVNNDDRLLWCKELKIRDDGEAFVNTRICIKVKGIDECIEIEVENISYEKVACLTCETCLGWSYFPKLVHHVYRGTFMQTMKIQMPNRSYLSHSAHISVGDQARDKIGKEFLRIDNIELAKKICDVK